MVTTVAEFKIGFSPLSHHSDRSSSIEPILPFLPVHRCKIAPLRSRTWGHPCDAQQGSASLCDKTEMRGANEDFANASDRILLPARYRYGANARFRTAVSPRFRS